jgi:hypothetical protein
MKGMMTRDQFWEYAEFITGCVGAYLVLAMFVVTFLLGGRACH